MKKYLSIIIPLLCNFLIISCYKDKSNYNYTEVDNIVIAGIEAEYSQITGADTLTINPIIQTTHDTTNFEYTWLLYDKDNNIDTIGKQRNLSFPIVKAPGEFKLLYFAKDKKTNLVANVTANLEVSSVYSKGHYILKETSDGNTDIDLLQDGGDLVSDILLKSQGATMNGKPRSLGILYNKPIIDPETLGKTTANCMGIITHNARVNILRVADMAKLGDHSSMFFAEVENDVPYKFYTNYIYSVYLSSTGTYSVGGSGTGIYGSPTNSSISGASDQWAFVEASLGFMYWDESNRRILYNNYGSTTSTLTSVNYPTSNLNYDCLHMGNYFGMVYILFKDRSDASKVYLYKVTGSSPFSVPSVTSVTEIPQNSKLKTATYFANNAKTAQLIYFVASNKLYAYDITTNSEMEVSPQGLPENETITYISNRYNYYTSPKQDYLTIATYLNGEYKILMYNIVGGLPYGNAARITSGKGKVKETHYMLSTFSSVYEGSPSYGYAR
ncbi:PKD-like family lipoprotein [Sphingobacterium sp. LRF_L2]|uniref:PKD-like family lipoprotein n=1 Tax=Sphingobacterium sp. LRF_L2 TaxID=3369421 RepID=UPI003F60E74F